ncbi:DUF72 domain-containing protein [Desulfofustis glycolicus]|uniref:Uncharacterized conserved protein YecE, DUF72 family n=1 Tax=Desulfofustis glycolicus DSM 9705 TaxID=1121409 RepID=A0A1M5UKR2_9BACT|nr:DUF72 domain-containing protein [Desulfofustis glycolicus]SHH63510.1 Uncharacterized conserved protein YecE, DUF72 family [Desulfofustis glycolicus DSM 9705]
MNKANSLHVGTCSWKYDSWRGIVYPESGPVNYLHEYSKHYSTVEVDQWFWSLFAGDKVVLPKPSVVAGYAASIPEDFIFSIKVPNSITLTHHYSKDRKGPIRSNPNFLSVSLMQQFLKTIEPLGNHIGPLVFQFEYLNKMKMSGLAEFLTVFGVFADHLPGGFTYCLETRNKNYLQPRYFDFLGEHDLYHVFLHGYYMPPIFDIYEHFREKITELTVIRLHGPDRQGIEKQTGEDWSRVVAPKEADISRLASMLSGLHSRQVETFLYVNNHFEGSAPRTITRIEKALAAA